MPDHDPHAPGFWEALTDTPAALEEARIAAGEPWTVSALAGLQYHQWQEDDGLDGRHEPRPGDRLQLVREPGNPYDGNAVAVEWRNGVRLGHLSRYLAAEVAAALDAGTPLRAYVLMIDDGEDDGRHYARRFDSRAWGLHALLVGEPARKRHGDWTTAAARRAGDDVWGEPGQYFDRWRLHPVPGSERRIPTGRQQESARAWEAREHLARMHRRAAAAAAFALAGPTYPRLPRGAAKEPDEHHRGMTFSRWEQVPPCLMTMTTLAKHGLRPKGPPFACIEYWGHGRLRSYDLHAVADARRVKRRTSEQRAAAAAARVMRAGRHGDALVL